VDDALAVEKRIGLLPDIEGFIKRFVAMDDDKVRVAAVWAIHTHCFEAFPQTPYLAITSPEKQCGKSRLLEVLGLLVHEPWPAVLPSEAVVYRKIEQDGPTLLLDEVDTIFNPRTADKYEGLRALLNAGHRQGAKVPRCIGPTSAIAEFSTFCPKVLAGIGTLPDTVADRSIPIRMERRTRDQVIERFRVRDVEPEAIPLRDQMQAWAADHALALADVRPAMPDELSDREQDGCEPLVAIAEALGSGELVREALIGLLTSERTDSDDSYRIALLRDLREWFVERPDLDSAYTTWLLDWLNGKTDGDWTGFNSGSGMTDRDLGKMLKRYGVHSAPVRADKQKQLKGYKRTDLQPVWERYL
jgi:Protein of unknown function (DUF3631)